MKIFNGKREAEKILQDLKKRIKKEKIKPSLAIILVGDDPASKLYIKLKKEAGKRVGVDISEFRFGGQAKEKEIIEKIKSLNKDDGVSGIIVQLPLPSDLKASRIIREITSKKDVDGFQKGNLHFSPVLAMAILIALRQACRDFSRKRALALVNSEVFAKILKSFLGKEGLRTECLLRGKRSFSEIKSKIKPKAKKADIIITALGLPCLIKSDMIKEGAILIDAGISRFGKRKVRGDVDKDLKGKACFLTPTPGGIGPLTVALLLKNVYLAERGKAERRLKMKANPKG